MPITTSQLQTVCHDLVAILQKKLPDQDPDLVKLIGQQYFMGSLSRMVSAAKFLEEQKKGIADLTNHDLYFTLAYPEEIDQKHVELIREESAKILAGCLHALKGNLKN
ncbi:MAG: hypothetical protein HQM14_04015 [SAR324 cluster bacterium]|nr:hypothetical protein [SAR324 cluster bacterium]